MARKKIALSDISLEDAFNVFERHGLRVKVEAVEDEQTRPKTVTLADFTETIDTQPVVDSPKKVSNKRVRITLYAQHSIGSAGSIVERDGNKYTEGNNNETYGPGIVTVPEAIAAQLLYQDGVARQADKDMLNPHMRTRIIVPHNGQNRLVEVSQDSNFDLSSFLGSTSAVYTV